MRRHHRFAALPSAVALLGALLLHAPARADEVATAARTPSAAEDLALVREAEDELVKSLRTMRKATVSVMNRQRAQRPGRPMVLAGVGSAVIVRHRGVWAVTNVHVVKDAEVLEVVTWDGQTISVRVVGRADRSDLALLSFDRVPDRITAVPLRTRGERPLEEGAFVVATGNPFFLANDGLPVATFGVVSGRERRVEGAILQGRTLQHDAAINPGNSGGPLWSIDGRLVGINETIATHSRSQGSGPCSTGACFSIPMGDVSRVVARMIERRTQEQAASHGFRLETVRDESGNPRGAQVTQVDAGVQQSLLPGSPIEGGDVIFAVTVSDERRSIRTAGDVPGVLEAVSPGTTLRIHFRRGDRRFFWTGSLGQD